MIKMRPARWPEDLVTVQQLFREYVADLGVDLSFQGFTAELEGLPGKYAPPRGRVILAWRGTKAMGCVAMRPLGDGRCEMKRLYVRPAARGEHVGRRLAQRVCVEERVAGHSHICLDTLPSMATAQALYHSLGFEPVAPYVFNPIEGTKYLALDLRSHDDSAAGRTDRDRAVSGAVSGLPVGGPTGKGWRDSGGF